MNLTGMRMIRSGCKINLFLHVLGRRADGYHDIDSLFLPLDTPYDAIEVTPVAALSPGTVRCAFFSAAADGAPPLPLDDIDPHNNTLSRASALYAQATGFAPGLAVRVIKGVPQGAGLGSGSANAAALLLHLQDLARRQGIRPLEREALVALAAQVGADVPFFLQGRPARIGGIGEVLTPCEQPFAGFYLVLVCPAVSVSTAWAFNTLDERRDRALLAGRQKNEAERLTINLPRATTSLVQAQNFKNDFEELVFAHFPEPARLHGLLCGSGAELARMSGTGASIFALYREKKIAQEAAKMLANENARVYTQRLPAGEPRLDAGV